MIKVYKYHNIINIALILCAFMFGACANPLPPTGGEDDTTPPKIVSMNPRPNTVNFTGNVLTIEFDDYVDRRSFRESFFVSPKPKGELIFNWSGAKLEIEFPEKLRPSTTYTFVIGKGFRDIRGNVMTEPVQFALSTGNKIDSARISGRVYTTNYSKVYILAYALNGKVDSLINPEKTFADYITQVSDDGSYTFLHLPSGKFRFFSLKDNTRNLLYDKGSDEIAVLSGDLDFSDSSNYKNQSFLFDDFLSKQDEFGEKFYNDLNSDTITYIASSMKNNQFDVSVDPKIYLYFRNNKLSKQDIAGNIYLYDTTNKQDCRVIINWLNDSLLEIVPLENLKFGSVIKISVDLKNTARKYIYENKFNVAEERRFGQVSGRITGRVKQEFPVYVKLLSKNDKFLEYSLKISYDTSFSFRHVLEGEYILFSFIDENNNRKYDAGNYYPFKHSEKFYIIEKGLNLKGGWDINAVPVSF